MLFSFSSPLQVAASGRLFVRKLVLAPENVSRQNPKTEHPTDPAHGSVGALGVGMEAGALSRELCCERASFLGQQVSMTLPLSGKNLGAAMSLACSAITNQARDPRKHQDDMFPLDSPSGYFSSLC